jgi:hypothetical protein
VENVTIPERPYFAQKDCFLSLSTPFSGDKVSGDRYI